MPHPLLTSNDRIYVINLPHRTDRRAEISEQLRKVGFDISSPPVTVFPAVRPEDSGPFSSVGARGCFLSHLGVLKDALERNYEQILILEDDADFSVDLLSLDAASIPPMLELSWTFFYLGYWVEASPGKPNQHVPPLLTASSTTPIQTLHAVMVRRTAIEKLVPYLEAMLARPPGDPAGGPMHVDGAYSWFREEHPELTTVMPPTQWAIQRSSKTDIAQLGWKERIPFIAQVRRLRNILRS